MKTEFEQEADQLLEQVLTAQSLSDSSIDKFIVFINDGFEFTSEVDKRRDFVRESITTYFKAGQKQPLLTVAAVWLALFFKVDGNVIKDFIEKNKLIINLNDAVTDVANRERLSFLQVLGDNLLRGSGNSNGYLDLYFSLLKKQNKTLDFKGSLLINVKQSEPNPVLQVTEYLRSRSHRYCRDAWELLRSVMIQGDLSLIDMLKGYYTDQHSNGALSFILNTADLKQPEQRQVAKMVLMWAQEKTIDWKKLIKEDEQRFELEACQTALTNVIEKMATVVVFCNKHNYNKIGKDVTYCIGAQMDRDIEIIKGSNLFFNILQKNCDIFQVELNGVLKEYPYLKQRSNIAVIGFWKFAEKNGLPLDYTEFAVNANRRLIKKCIETAQQEGRLPQYIDKDLRRALVDEIGQKEKLTKVDIDNAITTALQSRSQEKDLPSDIAKLQLL